MKDLLTIVRKRQLKNYISIPSIVVSVIVITVAAIFIIIMMATLQDLPYLKSERFHWVTCRIHFNDTTQIFVTTNK